MAAPQALFHPFYRWSSLRGPALYKGRGEIYNLADGWGSMGNSIIGKKVVMMMVVGVWGAEGMETAFLPPHVHKMYSQVASVVSVSVMGVTRTWSCLEVAAGCRPRGEVVGRQLSPASRGLSERRFCGEAERESLCVQECEAQSEAFLFIVAVCIGWESHPCTHTHSSASSLQNYMRGIHASVNRQFQTLTILHPVEVFFLFLISSSLLLFSIPNFITTNPR